MKKAFVYSLLVHFCLIFLAFFLIKTPNKVEVVTIPLNMSTSFEAYSKKANEDEITETLIETNKEKIVKTNQQKVEKEFTKIPIETKQKLKETVKIKVAQKPKKIQIPKKTKEIVQAQTLKQVKKTDESSSPLAQTKTKVETKGNLKPQKQVSSSITPNLKVNFDIIRKKTYERLYYPKSAQNALKEGIATLIFKLNKTGLVEDIVLEKSTGYKELDKIVLKAGQVLKGEKLQYVGNPVNIRLSIEFAVPNKRV